MQRIACLALLFLVAAAPQRPDDKLSPGAVAATDAKVVCRPGYSGSVRHTSTALKMRIYHEYNINPSSGKFEVDHRVPLSLGGADTGPNLWPQSYTTKPYNAYIKDKLEARLHALVCNSHKLTLEAAQQVFMGDWITAYHRYFGGRIMMQAQ